MSQIFKLKNGTQFLITEAPGGIYNSLQLKKISELCNRDLAIVKATEDQRIGLFVKEGEAEAVVTELQAVGLGLRKYQQGLHQPVSCIGELCEEHDQDALGASMDITKELADIQLATPLRIGINGCARCCTPCHTLDISIIGEARGYRISLGGKGSQIPELAAFMAEGVPTEKLPGMVKKLVEIYHNHAGPEESLQEVLERCGVGEFVEALAPYSQDAAHSDDPLELANQVATEHPVDESGEGQQPEADPMEIDNLALDDEVLEGLAEDLNEEQVEQDTELDNDIDQSKLDDLDDESLEIAEDKESVTNSLTEDDLLHFDSSVTSDLDEDLSPADDDSLANDEPADVGIDDDIDLSDFEEIPIKAEPENLKQEAIDNPSVSTSKQNLQSSDDEQESMATMAEDKDEAQGEFNPLEASSSLDEGDPLAEDYSDAEKLSEEDELDFEKRLNESIDEETALIAAEEKDLNEDERQATLGMLESTSATELENRLTASEKDEIDFDESSFESIDESDDLGDQSDEPIDIAPQVAGNKKTSPAHSRPKASGYMKFSGMELIDQDKVHLTFDSGAYIEIDLSSLQDGQQKSISMGGQSFVLEKTEEGIFLEVEGVRLFHPVNLIQEAS